MFLLKDFKKIEFISSRFMTNSLFGLALFIVILCNLFAFLEVSKLGEANKWVVHTYQVIESLENGFLKLVEIESTTCGFLLNHNQDTLENIQNDLDQMQQSFDLTKQQTLDNPSQQRKLKTLNVLGCVDNSHTAYVLRLVPESSTRIIKVTY